MSSRRILIVEDERRVLQGWARTLRLAGYSVVTAQTAQQALQLCDEHLFDLVILDFLMPAMDGVELLGRIRKRLPLVRSIVVSGKIDSSVSRLEIASMLREQVEADRYLDKPVSNDRLKATIEELLTSGQSEKNWQEVAKRSVDVSKSTIRSAKQVSKELKKFVKQKTKKR